MNSDFFVESGISTDFIAQKIKEYSTKNNIGGHSIFLGQIRDDIFENKKVKAIEFSCYKEMAEEKILKIKKMFFLKYDLIEINIYHSLGVVNRGEICLFVFVSSVHRKVAIQSCDELVEYIKKEVPIWGKEIFEDNSYRWKRNTK